MDKDPDLRKKSDAEADAALLPPTPRWWQARWARVCGVVIMLAVVVAGTIALIVFAGWAGLELFARASSNAINTSEASAAGAWASAAGATALALASVWIAWQANKQAREAEKRAEIEVKNAEKRHEEQMAHATKTTQDDLERLQTENEYQAVQEILQCISTVASEVGAMDDLIGVQKEAPSQVTTAQLIEGRKSVVSHTNAASLRFMMALPRLAGKELLEQAYILHETMQDVLKSFNGTDPDHPIPNWNKAADNLRPMLEALQDMQSVAIGYFSVYKKMQEAGEASEEAA